MNSVEHTAEERNSTPPKDDRISARWKYCARYPVENPTQRAILTVIGESCDGDKLVSYVSKLNVAERIGASRTTLYRAIKRMEEQGILTADDYGTTTYWQLPELYEIRAFAKHISEQDAIVREAKQAAKAANKRPTIPEDMKVSEPSEESSLFQSETSLFQSETSPVQSETAPVQSETALCPDGTQSGILSGNKTGNKTGNITGDGKACDSTSFPDVLNSSFLLLNPKTRRPRPRQGRCSNQRCCQ